MSESREMRALRAMAWERAKGELRSMLHTYYEYDERGQRIGSYFEQYSQALKAFIKKVEDNGWQE